MGADDMRKLGNMEAQAPPEARGRVRELIGAAKDNVIPVAAAIALVLQACSPGGDNNVNDTTEPKAGSGAMMDGMAGSAGEGDIESFGPLDAPQLDRPGPIETAEATFMNSGTVDADRTTRIERRPKGGDWEEVPYAGDGNFEDELTVPWEGSYRAVQVMDNGTDMMSEEVELVVMEAKKEVKPDPEVNDKRPGALELDQSDTEVEAGKDFEITGKVPDKKITDDVQWRVKGEKWDEIETYTPGDGRFSLDVTPPGDFEFRAVNKDGKASEPVSITLTVPEAIPLPVDVQVDETLHVLSIDDTEFPVNLTVGPNTKTVEVYRDGVFIDQIVTNGETLIAYTVAHPAGTEAVYGFVSVNGAGMGTVVEVNANIAAPTISAGETPLDSIDTISGYVWSFNDHTVTLAAPNATDFEFFTKVNADDEESAGTGKVVDGKIEFTFNIPNSAADTSLRVVASGPSKSVELKTDFYTDAVLWDGVWE